MTTTVNLAPSHLVNRPDAVWHRNRAIVPTSAQTRWVGTWDEFKAAGGRMMFNEDQTEITLVLPEPYKFGIGFQRAEGES